MSLGSLVALYLLVGLACAVAVVRRSGPPVGRAILSAFVTVPLWPLWAPFVLTSPRRQTVTRPPRGPGPARATRSSQPAQAVEQRCAERIDANLTALVAAIAGTALSELLSGADAEALMAEVREICLRVGEIDRRIAAHGLEPLRLRQRQRELERRGASVHTVAAARQQVDEAEWLGRLRDRQRAALTELGDLTELLRTQLMLASVGPTAGAPALDEAERTGELAGELWAKLEGLRALSDPAQLDPAVESLPTPETLTIGGDSKALQSPSSPAFRALNEAAFGGGVR